MKDTKQANHVFRGMMIIFIVIGHNRILTGVYSGIIFQALYFWHVQSFFMEPVLYRSLERYYIRRLSDILVRYLWPYAVILTIGATLAHFSGRSEVSALVLFKALYSGFSRYCEKAVGMSLYWFLPTFASFSVLLKLYSCAVSKWPSSRDALLATSCAGGAAVAITQPVALAPWVPFGLLIAIYMMPQVLIFERIMTLVGAKRNRVVLVIIISLFIVALKSYDISWGIGLINISDYRFGDGPLDIFLSFLSSISMSIIFRYLAIVIVDNRPLNIIGRNSLVIYLFHPFIQYPLGLYALNTFSKSGDLLYAILGSVIVICTVCACLIISKIFNYTNTSWIFMPKSLEAFGIYKRARATRAFLRPRC